MLNEERHPLYGALLLGIGRFYGLCHLSLDFLNPSLEPSNLFEEGAFLDRILRRLKKVENWMELPLVELTSTLTLDIAGKVTVEGLGAVLGAYLHPSRLNEYSAAHLVKRLHFLRLGAVDYELGECEDFASREDCLCQRYGRNNLLFLAMDYGEEAGMYKISGNENDLSTPCWNVFQLVPTKSIRQMPRNALTTRRRETIQGFSGTKAFEGNSTPYLSESSVDMKSFAEATAIAACWRKNRENAPHHEIPLSSLPALSFELMKMAESVKIAWVLLES